jgi:hypothetical protein
VKYIIGEIIPALMKFASGGEFYNQIGWAWKRAYLLYIPTSWFFLPLRYILFILCWFPIPQCFPSIHWFLDFIFGLSVGCFSCWRCIILTFFLHIPVSDYWEKRRFEVNLKWGFKFCGENWCKKEWFLGTTRWAWVSNFFGFSNEYTKSSWYGEMKGIVV